MDQESTNNDDLASQLATNEIPDTVEPHSEPINSIAEELGTNTNTTTTATSSPVIPTPDIPEMNSEGNTTVQESEELENVDPVHEEPIETEDQKLAEPELGPTENDSTELDNDEPAHDTVESNEEPEEISQTETDHSFTESNEEPKELSQPEADHSFIESNEIAEDDFDDFNNTIKDESVQDQENENVNESVNENENENENKNENENENKTNLVTLTMMILNPKNPTKTINLTKVMKKTTILVILTILVNSKRTNLLINKPQFNNQNQILNPNCLHHLSPHSPASTSLILPTLHISKLQLNIF